VLGPGERLWDVYVATKLEIQNLKRNLDVKSMFLLLKLISKFKRLLMI